MSRALSAYSNSELAEREEKGQTTLVCEFCKKSFIRQRKLRRFKHRPLAPVQRFCSLRCGQRGKNPHGPAERLQRSVVPDGECLIWQGKRRTPKGYGVLKIYGQNIYAHRLAWSLANNQEIPDGLQVLHRCDRPGCVQPTHLFLGTQADNMKDMAAKGRRACQRGELSPTAKLTREDVLAIHQDQRSRAEVAADYGISDGYVGDIRAGRAWRWLLEPEGVQCINPL